VAISLPLAPPGLLRFARKDEHCEVQPFTACPDQSRRVAPDGKMDVSLFPVTASPDSVGAGLVPALTLVTMPGGYKTLPYTCCAMASAYEGTIWFALNVRASAGLLSPVNQISYRWKMDVSLFPAIAKPDLSLRAKRGNPVLRRRG